MSGPAAAADPTGAIEPRRPPRVPRVGAVPSRATSRVVLVAAAILFLVPILAMVQFTLRLGQTGALTLGHYAAIADPAQESNYDDLFVGIGNSLGICILTVAIVLLVLLPSMLLVELRYPRLRRAIEFTCLLPVSLPTVVLVVGLVPVYQVVTGLFGDGAWTLAFAIGVIVLPYAYRPIQANLATVAVVTLAEAARSLGASWSAVIWRVVLPNLRRGILSACFLTIAVVLGEFTIATFLSQNTFQTALLLLQQTDPYVATIFAVFALLFAFVLLVLLGRISAAPRTRRSR